MLLYVIVIDTDIIIIDTDIGAVEVDQAVTVEDTAADMAKDMAEDMTIKGKYNYSMDCYFY